MSSRALDLGLQFDQLARGVADHTASVRGRPRPCPRCEPLRAPVRRCRARRSPRPSPGVRARRTHVRDAGPSWISSPTPWPRPCVNASPYPAPSITSRAAASTSAPLTPSRTASIPACWACRHDIVDLLQLRGGLAERDRARHVGVVATVQGAEVHLDDVAFLEGAVPRLVVRLGRVLTEGHDRTRTTGRPRRLDAAASRARGPPAARSRRRRASPAMSSKA